MLLDALREDEDVVEVYANHAFHDEVLEDVVHVPPSARALLFWLLTSEPCEHVYGLSWKIIVDFNLLDFYYMFPKLYVLLTSTFPTDQEINQAAQ